jgi:hypothetical protein
VLLRMVPDAISASWDEVKLHIERALPDSERTEKTLSNILSLLLLERADCWAVYDDQDNNKVCFVVVTMPVFNGITGEKNLLLYNVTNSEKIDLKTSNRMWLEGFQALQKYMKANGFSKLVSYFDDKNHRSFKLAERFGADVRYYIELEV